MTMDTLLLALTLAVASAEEIGPAEEAQEVSQNLTELLVHLRSIPTPEDEPTTLESLETEDPPDGDPLIVSVESEDGTTPDPDKVGPQQDTSTDTDAK